jgi:hypothetical protein
VRDDEDVEQPRPPSLARAIRDAFPRYLDEIVLVLLVNLGWALLLAAFAFVRIGIPVAIVLAPLFALPTAALMRLAVASARDRSPRVAMARDELGRLAGRKVALAAIQLVVMAVGIANVFAGGGIAGILGALSAIISGYVVLATWVYATALWPIVCDPEREGPVREQLRLALAVVVLRPLQIGLLAIMAALAVIVSVQLIVPSIFLPSLILLAVTGYVVPSVDALRRPVAP